MHGNGEKHGASGAEDAVTLMKAPGVVGDMLEDLVGGEDVEGPIGKGELLGVFVADAVDSGSEGVGGKEFAALEGAASPF